MTEAYVVVDSSGLDRLEADILAPRMMLDQLHARLGPRILPRSGLRVRPALHQGRLVDDDADPLYQRIYRDTLWQASRDAVARAGAQSVIFGLVDANAYSIPVWLSTFFQLLAREQDELLSVVTDDPRVERASSFFFPEQESYVNLDEGDFDPVHMTLRLRAYPLPKLGMLLGSAMLRNYEDVLSMMQTTARAAAPPWLEVDLDDGRFTVDGQPLDLSVAERLWYGYLAWCRGHRSEGWVEAGQDGHAAFRRFLMTMTQRAWARPIRTRPLVMLLNNQYVPDEDLRNLRGKTVQRLKKWCQTHCPEHAALLVPQSNGRGYQRIPLTTARLRVRGAPDI